MGSTPITFARLRWSGSPPIRLVFGGVINDPGGPVDPEVPTEWGGTALLFDRQHLSGPTTPLVFGGRYVPPVVVTAGRLSFDGAVGFSLSAAIAAAFNNSVDRGVRSSNDSRWQQADRVEHATVAPFGAPTRLRVPARFPWRRALTRRRDRSTAWQQMQPRGDALTAPWIRGDARRVSAMTSWQVMTPRPVANGTDLPWREGRDIRRDWSEAWKVLAPRYGEGELPWREAERLSAALGGDYGRAATRYAGRWLPWREAAPLTPGRSVRPGPPEPHRCYVPGVGYVELKFFEKSRSAFPVELLFRCGPNGGIVPPTATVVIPVRRVYFVLNSTALLRVSDGAEIPTIAMSASLDFKTWTWGFQASIPAAAQSLVEPVGGAPVELAAWINGTEIRLVVTGMGSDRTFGRSVVSISGSGRAALLGDPFAPVMSFTNASDRTARQLIDDALTVNGVGLGWDVDFGLTDWLVPAGVWTAQGTYIDAVNRIAAAAGGYVQPHNTAAVLRVLPTYPAMPWEWAGVTPDVEIPADVAQREGIQWTDKPTYTRVFVAGQTSGRLVQATRIGTDGSLVAPMVTDPLITHVDAGRQRAMPVLGDVGRQALISLRMPVLPDSGLIMPGKFVRYVDGGVTRVGIVRSLAVDAPYPDVWQTIGVETHV